MHPKSRKSLDYPILRFLTIATTQGSSCLPNVSATTGLGQFSTKKSPIYATVAAISTKSRRCRDTIIRDTPLGHWPTSYNSKHVAQDEFQVQSHYAMAGAMCSQQILPGNCMLVPMRTPLLTTDESLYACSHRTCHLNMRS